MKQKHLVLKKALITTGCCLFALVFTGNKIAVENAAQVNKALNIQEYTTQQASGSENSDVFKRYYSTDFKSIKDLKAYNNKVCQEVEAEGASLLVNKNNTLPLTGNDKKVALFGTGSIDPARGGTGSGSMSMAGGPTMREAFENAGLTVHEGLWNFYDTHKEYRRESVRGTGGSTGQGSLYKMNEAPWSVIEQERFDFSDSVAIMTISRVGGEGKDASMTESPDGVNGDYLRINADEESILLGLKQLKDVGKVKKIVILIDSAHQISCNFIEDSKYGIDAALWIGLPGVTGLNAVGEILAGKVNPSGSISSTFWYDNFANPVLANYGTFKYENEDFVANSLGSNNSPMYNSYVVYKEGVYREYIRNNPLSVCTFSPILSERTFRA